MVFGSDSLALDIQRSRDHGLASYTKYVKFCTGQEIQSWNDLEGKLNSSDLEVFRNIYKTPEDIDLIVGALAEIPAKDATVGPTFQCIIGELRYFLSKTDLKKKYLKTNPPKAPPLDINVRI